MKRKIQHGIPLYFLLGPDCLDLLELFIHLEFGLTREDLIDEATDLGPHGQPQNKIPFDQYIDAVEFQRALIEENIFEQMEEDDGTSPSWDEIARQEAEAMIEDEDNDKYRVSEEEELLFSFRLTELAAGKQAFYVLKTHVIVYAPGNFSQLTSYNPFYDNPSFFDFARFH